MEGINLFMVNNPFTISRFNIVISRDMPSHSHMFSRKTLLCHSPNRLLRNGANRNWKQIKTKKMINLTVRKRSHRKNAAEKSAVFLCPKLQEDT